MVSNAITLFDVPNLDDMSISSYDYAIAADIFLKLHEYCNHKRDAMESRQVGDIKTALGIEKMMEGIYKSLPIGYRW